MAYREDGNGSGGYTQEEQFFVDKAKAVHKDTTQTLQKGLKTVNETQDIAQSTLVELHRQREILEKVDRDADVIKSDIKEADGTLDYMKRPCCYTLCIFCCDCDKDKTKDATRKARVNARDQAVRYDNEYLAEQTQARASELQKMTRGDDDSEPVEEVARGELFGKKPADASDKARARFNSDAVERYGRQLDEPDRLEVQKETQEQEFYLDEIMKGVDNLRGLASAMQGEMEEQDPMVDRVTDKVVRADDNLHGVMKKAGPLAGRVKRPKGEPKLAKSVSAIMAAQKLQKAFE